MGLDGSVNAGSGSSDAGGDHVEGDMRTPGVAWEKPGAGSWVALPDHFPGSVTPLYRELHQRALEQGIATMFERYGVPLETMSERFVHGHVYGRLRPLIMADKDAAKPPPAPVPWLVTRLHPAFRARTRTARRVLAEKPWLAATADWESSQRDERERRNL